MKTKKIFFTYHCPVHNHTIIKSAIDYPLYDSNGKCIGSHYDSNSIKNITPTCCKSFNLEQPPSNTLLVWKESKLNE